MSVVAIIPARGGSVGLPGKNIRLLNGTPLIGRTIRAAKGSNLLSGVYVSSDSQDILDVASLYGASTIVRPTDLAGSKASSESALLHAIHAIVASSSKPPEYIVFLQCTSPFTTSKQIDDVIRSLWEYDADSAFSAIEDHSFVWEVGADGTASGITHDHKLPRQRRQDLKPRYKENGAIYAMRVSAFLEANSRFCGKTIIVPVDMPPIEIDTLDDWVFADSVAKHLDRREIIKTGSIRAVVTDFDGVHTDNRVMLNSQGDEFVTCNRSDGMGIELLKSRKIQLLILSKESNPIVFARGSKLNMEVCHRVDNKLPILDKWRKAHNLEWSQIAYIGNDINDLECMTACGLSFCPNDAHNSARDIATVILSSNGGAGAIREMADYLIANELVVSA